MNKFLSLFLIGFLSAIAGISKANAVDTSLESDGVVLSLLETVEAPADAIRLRDLLASTTVSSFGDIQIAIAPALGKETIVRRSDLDARLRQIHPRGTWTWIGAEQCVVTRPAVEVTENDIVALIEDSLRNFSKKDGEVKVVRLLGYSPFIVPKNGSLTQVELVSPNGNSRFGGAMLNVDYQGRSFVRRNMRFEWEWKKPVWVSQQPVSAGRSSPASFALENRDVLSLPGEPLDQYSMPQELGLTRSLARGEVLMKAHLKSPIAVTSGSDVVANIRAGALLVSMKAIALENGVIGQNIKIQNPTSHKELVGRIVQDRVVEVTP